MSEHKTVVDCDFYDITKAVEHLHCAICECIVLIERHGYESTSFAVIDGAKKCSRCAEITCADHLTKNTPDSNKVCSACADDLVSEAQTKDDLGVTAGEMVSAVRRYLACLRAEANPVAIQETIRDFHELQGLLAEVDRALPEQIERAYGLQRTLPG